jgi:epsilon-lactone hydrolase
MDFNMISDDAKRTKEFLFSLQIASLHEAPLTALRENMLAQTALIQAPEECLFEPVDARGVPAVWIKTTDSSNAATIVYLHGGAYTLGSHQTHRGLLGLLCKESGLRVLAVDYRLAPENPYPAALDDAITAYQWLLDQNVAPAQIVMGGDSAGGGLTVATLLKLKSLGLSLPAAAFLFSPWVDLEGTGETIETKAEEDPIVSKKFIHRMAGLYAGQTSKRTPYVSPLFGDLAGLPPTLIEVGTAEMLLSDSLRLAEAFRRAGVDCTLRQWDDMFHAFQLSTFLPESKESIQHVVDFVKARL